MSTVVSHKSSKSKTPKLYSKSSNKSKTSSKSVKSSSPSDKSSSSSSKNKTASVFKLDSSSSNEIVRLADETLISEAQTALNCEHPIDELEQVLIDSNDPIPFDETSEITANDVHGIWLNKSQNLSWKGPMALEKYKLNLDPNPEVLKKKPTKKLLYKQLVNVKYLNPPKLPKPGDIIIRQLPNKQIPPAPPLIIRQDKPRIPTPPPLVIREEPPKAPPEISSKIINISGKTIPPPARKVILEKLPHIPARPQSILIERWLPYKQQKRKIIFKKAPELEIIPDPKNVVVEWDSPDVEVTQSFKNMGVYCADPKEYIKRYGAEVKVAKQLPRIARKVKAPAGLTLASEHKNESLPCIEGDLEALKLIDLDQAGLGEYRHFLTKSGHLSTSTCASKNDSYNILVKDLFRSIDCDNHGYARVDDAHRILYALNIRFGKKLKKRHLKKYLYKLDTDDDQCLTIEEFRTAFLNCAC